MFASAGKSLHIYTLEKGSLKPVSQYAPKPSAHIKHISWCHDNSYIAIVQENEHPQILSTKDPLHIEPVHTISSVDNVSAIKFKVNTKRSLALGTKNGEVMLYDTKNRCVSKVLGQLSSEITAMEFISPNELAVISFDSIVLFNLTDPAEHIELPNPDQCTALKCLNKNSRLSVGLVNGMVIIWDLVSRREVKTFHLHSAAVTGIVLSPKEKLLITTGKDNKICVIDYSTQECTFKKLLHQAITSVDISAAEQHMVVGLKDGSIYVYQMNDHLKPQICSKMHPTSVNQISFINGISYNMMESDSLLEEESECEVRNLSNKEKESSLELTAEQSKVYETSDISNEPQMIESRPYEDLEVPEEKVKLDLIKLVNNHFSHLEDQLSDHCGRLQNLVSTELDSLYAVAARWECFKTMELEEIVRYICGIVSAASDTRVVSDKSEHINIHKE